MSCGSRLCCSMTRDEKNTLLQRLASAVKRPPTRVADSTGLLELWSEKRTRMDAGMGEHVVWREERAWSDNRIAVDARQANFQTHQQAMYATNATTIGSIHYHMGDQFANSNLALLSSGESPKKNARQTSYKGAHATIARRFPP